MAETFKVGANARELLRYTQRATRTVSDDISRSDARAVIQKLRRDSSKRMKNKIKYWETAYLAGEATKQEILRSFDAWDAHAAHGETYSLRRKYADRLEKLLDCKIPIHRKINSNKLARDRRRARQCRCIYKKQHKALSLSVSQNTRPAEIMPWA